MAFIDVRDEHGTLLLRFDPEAHIIEVFDRHYDNVTRKAVKRRRLIRIDQGAPVLLPVGVLLSQTITIKERVG